MNRSQPPRVVNSDRSQGLHQQQEVREIRFVSWRAGFMEHLLQLLTTDQILPGEVTRGTMGKKVQKRGWGTIKTHLVGAFNQLEKTLVNGKDYPIDYGKNHVWNHQPDILRRFLGLKNVCKSGSKPETCRFGRFLTITSIWFKYGTQQRIAMLAIFPGLTQFKSSARQIRESPLEPFSRLQLQHDNRSLINVTLVQPTIILHG